MRKKKILLDLHLIEDGEFKMSRINVDTKLIKKIKVKWKSEDGMDYNNEMISEYVECCLEKALTEFESPIRNNKVTK